MSTIESYRRNGKAMLKKYPILLLILVAARLGMKFLLKFTDVEIPGWVMVVVFAVTIACFVVLFVMDVVRREKKLSQMEQLEQEQSRRPVQQDSVSGFLRKHGAANSRKIYTKPKISAEEQAEAERLDDLNRESSTEWW